MLNMRMISELSLFTIMLVFSSQSTGTVKLMGIRARDCHGGAQQLGICAHLPAFVIRVHLEIQVLDMLGAHEGVCVRTRKGVGGCERPAILAHARRYDSHS